MLMQEGDSSDALPSVTPPAQPAAGYPDPAAPSTQPPAANTSAPAPATPAASASAAAPAAAAAEVPAAAASNLPQAADATPTAAGAEDASAEGEGEEVGSLPLPSEPTGVLGLGVKMIRGKAGEIAEHEKVKQSLQYAKDKTTEILESERVRKSVEWSKEKTTEIMESERVRKSVEWSKDKAEVVSKRASEVSEKAVEKAKQGVEYAKEKTKGLRENAGNVWESGRGSITRVRANVSNMSWKGSAKDTLDIAAREEQWKGIKIQGAEEISVPARTEHTCCYHVSKGSTLRWTFRVKDNDIGFGVRMRIQEYGGAREEDVLATDRYDSTDTISGSWVADEDRTMVLVFDNKYSKLRSKTVAYFTGTEKPPVFVETPAAAAAETAVSDPAPAATAPTVAAAEPFAPPAAASAAAPAADLRPIV